MTSMSSHSNQSEDEPSDRDREMLTHEDDDRIAPGEELPPIDVLLNEYGVIADLFDGVDITLMDGDVTGGEISSLTREKVTLYGYRRPFERWEPDMGISAKLLGTLCKWMDDDRFVNGDGTWRTWDDITLCAACYSEFSPKADVCDTCDEGAPFTPETPSIFRFTETHRFADAENSELLPINTSADLVDAILSVVDIHRTPDWWVGEPEYLIGLPET